MVELLLESPPKEEVFEDEQRLLKKVYETKSGLLEGRWIVQNKQSISQPCFISTNVIEIKGITPYFMEELAYFL